MPIRPEQITDDIIEDIRENAVGSKLDEFDYPDQMIASVVNVLLARGLVVLPKSKHQSGSKKSK